MSVSWSDIYLDSDIDMRVNLIFAVLNLGSEVRERIYLYGSTYTSPAFKFFKFFFFISIYL